MGEDVTQIRNVPPMNFLQTLLRPDREDEPDKALVGRAANLLQVGEFQLLQLAYREWHGENLPDALFDRLFEQYMLRDHVPVWARHYARNIVELDRQGRLDDRDPRFHRFDHDFRTIRPYGVRHFALAASMIAVVLFGGIVVSDLSTDVGTSILPPYFDANELPPIKTELTP
jgi:hypothetical protein